MPDLHITREGLAGPKEVLDLKGELPYLAHEQILQEDYDSTV